MNRIKKILLTILGFTFLAIGAIGVAIPVLPTTPLVLLAALCFSASNERLSTWLQKNRIFGQYITNYQTKQGISKSLKISSIAFVWIGLIISMVVVHTIRIRIMLGLVGIGVTAHLLTIKTREDRDFGD